MRDYLVEMLDALTSAYSRKDHDNLREPAPVETLIGKLFSVLAWGLNTVQEQAELIKLWDDIDNAHGSVLDRYGANFGGLSALLAMLNSCASGCSVVNIDNGFGAGYLASMINQMEGLE